MSFGSFKVGPFCIGVGHPPVFLAEIGALFGQDIDAAFKLIDSIAVAGQGPDKLPVVLKTEILHRADLCLDDDSIQTYVSKSGEKRVERYRDLIDRKVLPLETYAKLFERARALGLPTCASVYDEAAAAFAIQQGVVLLKVASSNLTHLPLLRYVGGLGAPLVIDTGRASLAEVDRAVATVRRAGATRLILQHSQDGHPSPAENGNLQTLKTFKRVFETPVGLSDHFVGTQMLHVAIGIGVHVLERNIAVDPDRLDDDHAFSSGLGNLEGLLRELNDSWLAIGRPFRNPDSKSGLIATSGRMGLITRRTVSAGEIIGPDTVAFAFPNKGIGIEHCDLVQGWSFISDHPAGSTIAWKHLRGS